MEKLLLYIFFFAHILSCSTVQPELGIASDFYPNKTLLNAGVVNKYYTKNIPTDSGKWSYIDVSYRCYKLKTPTSLSVQIFNAAMQLKYEYEYEFEDNKTMLIKKTGIHTFDNTQTNVINSTLFDWVGSGHVYKTQDIFERSGSIVNREMIQREVMDTLVENRKAKSFLFDLTYESVFDNDTTNRSSEIEFIFVEGLGRVEEIGKSKDWTSHTYLVEQMSIETFKNLQNHGKKRIAYIDPSKTLDDHTDFKLCADEKYIVDYYNGDPPAGVLGGKRTVQSLLKKHFDLSKIEKESGYLTYRYVVNCKGEAGRFTTEQTDLDFAVKSFDKKTIDHFYEIVREIENFQATKLNYVDDSDAYCYLTFKLKDGEVIEILP